MKRPTYVPTLHEMVAKNIIETKESLTQAIELLDNVDAPTVRIAVQNALDALVLVNHYTKYACPIAFTPYECVCGR